MGNDREERFLVLGAVDDVGGGEVGDYSVAGVTLERFGDVEPLIGLVSFNG